MLSYTFVLSRSAFDELLMMLKVMSSQVSTMPQALFMHCLFKSKGDMNIHVL